MTFIIEEIKAENQKFLELYPLFDSLCLSDQEIKSLFEEGTKDFATIIFFDIFSFSEQIKNLKAQDIVEYLKKYYKKSFKIVKEYDGVIEKVMGDGVIAVFSETLKKKSKEKNIENAVLCLKKLIEEFYNSDYEIKGAIHYGDVFFLEIGLEEYYYEYTVIGESLTYCYRLENIINKANQIVCLKSQAEKIDKFFPPSEILQFLSKKPYWHDKEFSKEEMKGITESEVYSYSYKK